MENSKKVSLVGTVLFTVCSILVLDSFVAPAIIGVSSLTVWIISAIIFFIPYGLLSAELGSTYLDDGGIVSWVGRAFGEFPSVLVGWMYWVNVAFWMPAVFVAFSSWFSMAFAPSASPWLLAAIAIVMCWLVVAIGIRGVDLSVAVSNIAAFCKVAIVVIMGILGVAYGVTRGFANDFSLSSFVPDMSHATEYIAIIVYNLLGFELISSVGGDIENPKKNIPKMTVFAGLIVTVLYIMGTFGILAAIPVDNISEADGFFYAIQELCSVFGPAQNAVFYVLIIVSMLTLVSNMVSWSMGAVETLGAIGMEERSPKLLGHKNGLPFYDLFAPMHLGDKPGKTYTVEEARALLIREMSKFTPEMGQFIDNAFENHWIDMFPHEGKGGGAGVPHCEQSRVLTNFTGSLGDVSTLAHELGHSLHSYFSHRHQRPMLAGYQIFVAEVASTVNELLLSEHLLQTSDDDAYRRYILSNLMEQFVGTCYRQPMFAQFEKDLHEWIEQRRPISSKTITDRCLELNRAYFGDAVIVDDLQRYGFYYVPHFYYNFYVYKYTLGMAVAISFVKEIRKGNVAAYREFLTKGGSESPLDELRHAGVDPASDKVYDDAFTYFQEIMAQFISLRKENA